MMANGEIIFSFFSASTWGWYRIPPNLEISVLVLWMDASRSLFRREDCSRWATIDWMTSSEDSGFFSTFLGSPPKSNKPKLPHIFNSLFADISSVYIHVEEWPYASRSTATVLQ
jgi:hypothetical protein